MPHEFDNPRPPAEDDRTEVRVTKLESNVIDIRERLVRIDVQMVTKEDLERAVATMVKWTIGLMFGFTTMTIMVMTFVMNYAAPPQGRFAKSAPEPVALAAPAQPPAIIITIPPGALQWQPAPEGAQQRKP